MNNSVKRAERRLADVEERMAGFGAPEPPADLLAKIQAEIPVELVAGERAVDGGATVPSGLGRHRWRLLAASLAVVSLAGLFGYRLLRQGLALEQAIDRGSEVAAPGRPLEIGEVPVFAERAQEVEVVGAEVEELIVGKDSGKEEKEEEVVPVGSVVGGASAVSNELNELAAAAEHAGGPVELGALAVPAPGPGTAVLQLEIKGADGAALPGTTVTLTGEGAREVVVSDAEGRVQLDQLARGRYELRAELDGFDPLSSSPVELEDQRQTSVEVTLRPVVQEELVVTSEAPLLDPLLRGRTARSLSGRKQARDNGSSAAEFDATIAPRRRIAPDREPPFDTRFQDYGTNPFVDTDEDPQSTFGIDVDTAAYTVARSYLERGLLPPPAAVRVEEFVNYFDYGDPAPRSRDFAVVVEGAPSPFAGVDAGSHLLRFALKGREVTVAERKPAVLTFVVDVSGSMDREDRLELVKRALRLLVRQLDGRDAIGLVIYGSRGELLLEPTSDHRRVLRAIESLRPGGSTNAEEGLVLGYRTARNAFRPGAINRVILCSDGVANVGRTGPEAILRRVADEASSGIELTTVGFGMDNFNDVLMEQLADQGDGNYAYVDDISAARRVFVENLTGTLETIAGDAKIQVEFNPAVVASYRLLGYENRDIADRDFRNDAVDAGEIGAGHQVTALYEVTLREREALGGEPVATLRLRYRSQRSGRMVEDAIDLDRDDLAWSWRASSTQLQLAAIVAEFAEQLRGSSRAGEVGLDALSHWARDLVGRVGARKDVAELATLIETAARLQESTGRPSPTDGFER